MNGVYTSETLKDIITWDIVNWSKALDYWTKNVNLKEKNLRCLELGGRNGGLSLWLALNENSVLCSDLESPEKFAFELHKKYKCNTRINYQSIDATKIPFDNYFDIITFKSILGGISRNNENELKKKTIDEIYKALKPGGKLLFAENIEASFIHKFFRHKFVNWGSEWNYLKYNEIESLFSSYKSIKYTTVGFWGAFGRNETQRIILGYFDKIFEKLVPISMRYVTIGIAEK